MKKARKIENYFWLTGFIVITLIGLWEDLLLTVVGIVGIFVFATGLIKE